MISEEHVTRGADEKVTTFLWDTRYMHRIRRLDNESLEIIFKVQSMAHGPRLGLISVQKCSVEQVD